MTDARLYLNVPFAEKNQAKALGARWDASRKKWYVPDGKPAAPFERWQPEGLPGGEAATVAQPARAKPTAKPAKGETLVTIAITQPLNKNFVPYSGDEPPWD